MNDLEELAQLLQADFAPFQVEPYIDHPGVQLSRVLDNMARAIRLGDRAAGAVGYRLLMTDPGLPFGKISKSNIARAFKQRVDLLAERERKDFASKTASLLSLPYCPRETEDYCRLLAKMGAAMAEAAADIARPQNDKGRTLVAYLRSKSERAP